MDRDQSGALTLRLLTGQPAEMAALQCVLEDTPSYFQAVPGARAFWRKLGYRETGQVNPAPPGCVAALCVMEKPLHRLAAR